MKKMYLMLTGLIFLLSLPFLQVGCGGTTTGNPMTPVTVAFGSYTAKTWYDWLIPSAYAAVSNVRFCFQRIRFKNAIDSPTGDNIDLSVGQVTISSTGTSLASVSVPQGTYSRIEFDLNTACTSGYSVQLTNSNGTFNSTDSITIRFDGTFSASGSSQTLALSIQAIMTQFNSVTSASSIITYAEAAGGSY